MSVFKVKLNNTDQGRLDTYPVAGAMAQASVSKQRQVYVMGPNRINRLMIDGEQFTDCNYWKKFAYPQVSLEQAFIEVVTDDGSVFVDGQTATYPKVYHKTVDAGTAFTLAANEIDILGDTGGYAVFCQISNEGGESVKVQINGNSNAWITVENGTAQVFNVGDLQISSLQFAHDQSGAAQNVPMEILVSIASLCTS